MAVIQWGRVRGAGCSDGSDKTTEEEAHAGIIAKRDVASIASSQMARYRPVQSVRKLRDIPYASLSTVRRSIYPGAAAKGAWDDPRGHQLFTGVPFKKFFRADF